MAGPAVFERITRSLIEALENVTTSAGYPLTFTVERPNPTAGNRGRDGLAVVVPGQPERDDPTPIGHDAWVLPYTVVISVIESEQSEESIDSRLDEARAAAESAIMQDRTRGGLAWDTVIDPAQFSPIEMNAHAGEVAVACRVRTRTILDDPYTSSFGV